MARGGKGASNFGGLRDAPALLDDGDDILIFVDNGSEVYLYAATHIDVIPSDELHLSGSESVNDTPDGSRAAGIVRPLPRVERRIGRCQIIGRE